MTDLSNLPAGLAQRPIDPKRKVPVPLMNMRPADPDDVDGEPTVADFTAIWAPTVLRCARLRLCGICGGDLGYRFAFLGGPQSAAHRAYTDPPFCLPCAEASLRLCPHVARPRHQRAPEHRLTPGTTTVAGFDADRPGRWLLGITRDYKVTARPDGIVFRPAPFVQVRTFGYDTDDNLVELGPA